MGEAINPKTRLDEKRNVPQPIQKILEWDVKATKNFVSFMLNFKPVEQFRKQCKFLEWTCHGVVWLACWAAFCYMIDNKDLYQMQINMFFGLFLDIIAVALIKAATRRRRPAVDDNPLSFGPDKFSFPSGHASRSILLFCFFTMLSPVPSIFYPPILAWTVSICVSRLLLYRHHILDVLAGMTLGVIEALVLAVLWLNQDTCAWIINLMNDEKLSGPEYDV